MTSENKRRWFLKRQGLHSTIQEILPLTGERVTIGRVVANTYALPSSYVSRHHATLTYNQGKWLIKDEKSMNGLFLNEIKLVRRSSRILAVGDVIGFGLPICKTNHENAFIYRVCSNIEDDSENGAITPIIISDDDEPENAYCAASKKVQLDLTSVPKSSMQNETLNEAKVAIPVLDSIEKLTRESVLKSSNSNSVVNISININVDPKVTQSSAQPSNHAVTKAASILGSQLKVLSAQENCENRVKMKVKKKLSEETLEYKPFIKSEIQPTVTPNATPASTSCKKVRETDQLKLQMPIISLKKCSFCGMHHCKSFKCRSLNSKKEESKSERLVKKPMPVDPPKEERLMGFNTSLKTLPKSPAVRNKQFSATSSETRSKSKEKPISSKPSTSRLDENERVSPANCFEERCGSPGLDSQFLNDIENSLDVPHLEVNENVIARFVDQQFDEHLKSVKGQKNDWCNVDETEIPRASRTVSPPPEVPRGISVESTSGKSSPWNEFDELENLQTSYSQNDEVICISDDEEYFSSQPQTPKTLINIKKEVLSPNSVLNDEADRSEEIPDEPFFPILSQSFFEGDEEEDEDHSTSSNAGFETKTRQPNFYSAKFTEPLPLQGKWKNANTSRYFRKTSHSSAATKPSHKGKKVKKNSPVTSNLKQKVQNLMGNRIPIPGGGSAIISTNSKPPPKPKSSKNWDITVNRSKNPSLTKKLNTKPKRTHRFESRSSFLVESEMVVPKQRVKENTLVVSKATVSKSYPTIPQPAKQTAIPTAVSAKKTQMSDTVKMLADSTSKSSVLDDDNKSKDVDVAKRKSTTNSDLLAKKVRFSKMMNDPSSIAPLKPNISNERTCSGKMNNDPMAKDVTSIPSVKPTVRICIDSVIGDILHWIPSWLNQQKFNPQPPPIVPKSKIWSTLHTYKSYDDYLLIYKPLLMLETWAEITKSWEECGGHFNFHRVALLQATPDIVVPACSTVFIDFTCQTFIKCDEIRPGRGLSEGDLVILHIPIKSNNPGTENKSPVVMVFSYVTSVGKALFQQNQDKPMSPVLGEHLLAHENCPKLLVTFTLRAKMRSVVIDCQHLTKVQIVTYLKPTLRLFEGLLHLPKTVMARDILNPRLRTCMIQSNLHFQFQAKGEFNSSQKSAILAIANAVSQGSCPKISILQGPPGTGKSHTIVGLVQELLFAPDMKSKCGLVPKILLTAPSNAAIDELCLRLLKVKQSLGHKRRLRIVRVGQEHSVHPQIREMMLEALVKSNVDTQLKELSTLESVEMELRRLQAKCNSVQLQIDSAYLRKEKEKEIQHKNTLADTKSKIKRLEQQKGYRPSQQEIRMMEERLTQEILENADVVATTLSSCRQARLENLFAKKTLFSACIVDEATQCVEPSTLLPLMYGISKLILVGDPAQLPATVLSKQARDCGFQQSLFQRLCKLFRDEHSEDVILFLNTQYRMHPEICRFPSKLFYDGKLLTDRSLEDKYGRSKFVPYLIFNILDSKETGYDGDLINHGEAEFVIMLLQLMVTCEQNNLSFGVITPYQAQKKKLRELLKNKSDDLARSIDVNTVDGFQGREKDIIIISTVRARSANGRIGFLSDEKRLNVALTRAKKCCFLCGHLDSLTVVSYWRAAIHDAKERGLVVDITPDFSSDMLKTFILKQRFPWCSPWPLSVVVCLCPSP